ncbi:probable glycosyltransferase At5g20260 [Oryza brachyantha]|uniref:probable glycosyltransferase At5g20260 n=1 Tax=Oryza brachyantha TaxID=4533 RepID=UPI001ADC46B3|nr:probable glycosyltransferase At5g20260 [Oryza brachyantha]
MASKNGCACHCVLVNLASCLLLAAAAVSVLAAGRVRSPAAVHHHSLSSASPLSRAAHAARELVNRHQVQVRSLEAGLAEARASIRRASRTRSCTPDAGSGAGGFVPSGAVYRDAYAFHQSYTEMEKRFKVWAYREGEPPAVVHKGGAAVTGADGIEGHLIAELEGGGGRLRARHPGEAHAFFLPISVANIVSYIHRRDMIDYWDPQLRLVAGYVDGLAAKYPFWNRSRGADHFFVSCHEWAPILSAAKPELRANAIRVMCNADMSDGFDPATDVALPVVSRREPAPASSERTVLALFAGGVARGGAVREALLARWEGRDDRVVVYGRLPVGLDHGELMGRARFCLCPCGGREGAAAASRRAVEAISAGCVPVFVAAGGDSYSPPFSDVLDWRRFSVAVPADRVGDIKDILAGISDHHYAMLHRRVLRVRRHFRLNRPAKRFDVVNMVIHSIWLRRLNLTLPY